MSLTCYLLDKHRYIKLKANVFVSFILLGMELQEDDQRRLVDVDCLKNKCSIHLIVHVKGGGLSTEVEVMQHDLDPTKVPSIARRFINNLLDIMLLDDEKLM